jgi:hypothetical protein
MDITAKLGWAEHTSDWDIGALIKTRDGKTIEIPQGYGDCLSIHLGDGEEIDLKCPDYYPTEDTKDFTLQLTEAACDTDDEDVHPVSIFISNILTISFFD